MDFAHADAKVAIPPFPQPSMGGWLQRMGLANGIVQLGHGLSDRIVMRLEADFSICTCFSAVGTSVLIILLTDYKLACGGARSWLARLCDYEHIVA